jgi:hypothetical protein
MVVKVSKPEINVREKISELDKPSGTAGQAMLAAETPQEQFNLIGAGRRNLIINGAMQVAQRGTSSASTGRQTVDRFYTSNATNAVVTQSQGTSNPPAGFSSYYRMNVDTADTSIGSSQYFLINYAVEGYDAVCTAWGTAYAVPVTMSFWVRSNVTGTYVAEIQTGTSPSYESSNNYTINNSDTWEKKTITVPPFTIASLNSTNGAAFYLGFWLAAGSTWNSGTISPQWTDPNSGRATGQVNALNAVNNYFDITGVQLELGEVATPFEHRSYGEELAACQRYYQQYGFESGGPFRIIGSGNGNNTMLTGFMFQYQMRSAPSINYFGGGVDGGNFNVYVHNTAQGSTAPASTAVGTRSVRWNFSGNGTYPNAAYWIDVGPGSNQMAFTLDAEL